MQISLADFSKGAVTPKYRIVEMTRDPKLMTIYVGIAWCIWILGWMWVTIKLESWWFFLLILLPLVADEWIYRKVYRWREKGTITLGDTALRVDFHDRTSEVHYKSLERIWIWTLVGRPLNRHGSRDPKMAIVVAFRVMIEGVEEELHVVNEMYLTPEDKLHFMRPPPSFGSLIFRLCETNKICANTRKGENWSDWYSA